MNLRCHKCHHHWVEDVPPGQTIVLCPRCIEVVPLVLATGAMQSQTQPSQSAAARAPTPARSPAADHKPAPARSSAQPAQTQPVTSRGATVVQQARIGSATVSPERTAAMASQPSGEQSKRDQPTRGTVITPMETSQAQAPPPPNTAGTSTATGGAQARLDALPGRTLDGYEIEKKLGAGGMGAVFRARQISLERPVAFKVLAPRLANNADFIARFTREALSAAQLNHHNIVQVYDVGEADGIHYITMEFVQGHNLGDIVRRKGRLQVDDATAYVLQAARGLQYAHKRGIIHRDIKPDNLMLNEHGVVKIADMGLAKRIGAVEKPATAPPRATQVERPGADDGLTRADAAMGTPAYMAPEQARDASSVDARADQYSLGCTLYYLCAGHTPYNGTTAFDMMSKHMNEPFTPLEVYVTGVPATLNAILNRMLEKIPARRYPGLGEVVRVLEAYLGVDAEKGPYTPREHHLAALEQAREAYYQAGFVKWRRLVKAAFFTLTPLLALLALFSGEFALAGGFLGLFVLTPLAQFILDGMLTGTYLFRRVRAVFFGMPLLSWLKTAAGGLLLGAALYLAGWLLPWLGFALVAAVLAAAYQGLILGPLRRRRDEPIEQMQEVLKELRLRGLPEEALHDFVYRFSGLHWEEFFEELFDYEAMVLTRGRWARAEQVKPRKRHAIWREPVARWLDGIEEARREKRTRKALTTAEARRLRERGATDEDAQKQAEAAATRFLADGFKTQPETKTPAWVEIKAAPGTKASRLWKALGHMPMGRIFALARGTLAVVMVLGWASQVDRLFGVPIPAALQVFFKDLDYYSWGLGGSFYALIGAVLLGLSAFSRALVAPALILTGVLLLVGMNVLIQELQWRQLTMWTAFWSSCALALMGLAGLVFFRRPHH